MDAYYPPWGFYYKVEFSISQDSNDARFQTVSGLGVEYDYESFKEGGENRFEHKLPVRTKYSDMVLKRGMLADSTVIKWFLDAFRERQFKPSAAQGASGAGAGADKDAIVAECIEQVMRVIHGMKER